MFKARSVNWEDGLYCTEEQGGTEGAGFDMVAWASGIIGSMSTPLMAAKRLLKWAFASELENMKQINITVEWIDILGTPI